MPGTSLRLSSLPPETQNVFCRTCVRGSQVSLELWLPVLEVLRASNHELWFDSVQLKQPWSLSIYLSSLSGGSWLSLMEWEARALPAHPASCCCLQGYKWFGHLGGYANFSRGWLPELDWGHRQVGGAWLRLILGAGERVMVILGQLGHHLHPCLSFNDHP